ncbi:MAG TPA: hypothetical protein VGS19_34930 [Streptosporangiaceae bacterium]|nr:hypothetical protein [Streptosporangiaceae bacterium]
MTGQAATPGRGEPVPGTGAEPGLAWLRQPDDAGQVLYSYSNGRFTFSRERFVFVAVAFAFAYVISLGVTAGHVIMGGGWPGGQLVSLLTATSVAAAVFPVFLSSARTARLRVCRWGLVIDMRRDRQSPYVVPYSAIDPASVRVRNRRGGGQSISLSGLHPVTQWVIDTTRPQEVLKELEQAMVSAKAPGACGMTERAFAERGLIEPPVRRKTQADLEHPPRHAKNPPGWLTRHAASAPEGARWAAYLSGLLTLGFAGGLVVGVLRLPAGLVYWIGKGAQRVTRTIGSMLGMLRAR